MIAWKTIDTVPDDGFFLVHEDGATRLMLRNNGEWKCTAVALDEYGDIRSDIRVRETGVHEPTHWAEIGNMPPSEE